MNWRTDDMDINQIVNQAEKMPGTKFSIADGITVEYTKRGKEWRIDVRGRLERRKSRVQTAAVIRSSL